MRDPRPGNWHDPSPRDRWNDRGPRADRGRDRHYDPWTEAPSPSPSPSEAPWRRRYVTQACNINRILLNNNAYKSANVTD